MDLDNDGKLTKSGSKESSMEIRRDSGRVAELLGY